MPLFSVVVVDYDGSVPRDRALRGLASVAAQRCRDFEVILLHDGPRRNGSYERELEGLDFPMLRIVESGQRIGDWGHSLRDRGIGLAAGDWIIHFNADNILYPEALATLAAETDKSSGFSVEVHHEDDGTRRRMAVSDPRIMVFPVLMRGMAIVAGHLIRFPEFDEAFSIVLSGLPPLHNRVDCMQVVAHRDLWREVGGWYDKSEDSDWKIYEHLFDLAYPRYVPRILGEHW
ncbi:MAG: glycosyltransferase [Alphaproteobacteria bacterium]|nr:glycosyltransferase [Alphaproteobacteria bacterium]